MPNFTKTAIKMSFIKLLNQHPLSQITVKDIVEDCGVNRNTFYYHFMDIPSLLQEIVTEEAEDIIEKHPSIDSFEECLEVSLQFALQNRKAVLHIHNSANRDIYENYLQRVCEHMVRVYFEKLLAEHNTELPEKDKELLIRLFKCECFGIILEWLNNGMKEDILDDFHRLCELKSRIDEEMIMRLIRN